MILKKPKIQRAYVNVRDPDTGENEHVTVYGKTVQEVIEHLDQDENEQAAPDKPTCDTAA